MAFTKAPEKFHHTLSGILKYVEKVCFLKVNSLEYWTEWYSYFPVFGQNLESAHTRENTDTILSLYGEIRIRQSSYFGILYAVKYRP